jgi:hypothetical protein
MRSKDETIKQLGDIVFLASQAFAGREIADLTETERQLVQKLQDGGFLTKDPDNINPTAGQAQ